jgi:L-ascorbate metabolism protein UlaG (beta-lactamase superfamily)
MVTRGISGLPYQHPGGDPMRLLLALTLAASPSLAQDRIPSHCIAVAAADPQVVPAALEDGLDEGSVLIRYIDHASFAIVTPDGTIAVTDYTGYIGTADVVPDVATMNNAHSSHWTAVPDNRIPHILQGWGASGAPADHRLDLGQMLVRNVTTDTRGPFGEGARKDGNSIFIFEAAGLCIGHLGHLHQIPSDEQYAAIGRLDVVMVPVDGGYTMRLEDMAGVVRRLRSSVVIPMHWFSEASLQRFLAEMAAEFTVVETGGAQIALSLDDLPSQPTIMLLEPAYLD